MQIVINLNESDYKTLMINGGNCSISMAERIVDSVFKGKKLPKGHGNLIQREDAEAIFKNTRKALYEQSRKERINDFQTRELMLLNAEQFVHLIQPIIEADTESEE